MPKMTEEQRKQWEEDAKKLQGRKQELEITLDRTAEMKALEDENKKLRSELDVAGARAFDKEVEKYTKQANDLGLEVGFIDSNDPKALEHLKTQITEKRAKKVPSGVIPLSHAEGNPRDFEEAPKTGKEKQIAIREKIKIAHDIPLDLMEFDSLKEMKTVLDKVAEDGNHPRQAEAQAFLAKLWKKHVLERRKPFDLSYQYDRKTGKFKEVEKE